MFNNLDNPSAVLDARVIHLATTESYRLCGHHPTCVHIHLTQKAKKQTGRGSPKVDRVCACGRHVDHHRARWPICDAIGTRARKEGLVIYIHIIYQAIKRSYWEASEK
jgi:hypothetical protein